VSIGIRCVCGVFWRLVIERTDEGVVIGSKTTSELTPTRSRAAPLARGVCARRLVHGKARAARGLPGEPPFSANTVGLTTLLVAQVAVAIGASCDPLAGDPDFLGMVSRERS
jgi:hypothetical protein